MITNTTKPYTNIRWMIRREMSRIAEIERQCFAKPWTESELCVCFSANDVIGMVVEVDYIPVGFMLYRRCPTRFELMKIAVAQNHRRQGIASLLVAKLCDKIPQYHDIARRDESLIRNRINALVPETNLEAQCLLRKHKFRAISILRDHYSNPTEDGYLFSRINCEG